MGLYKSNDVSEPNKPDTEQAKIDAHLEQQSRKSETSLSGGAAARAPAPATTSIKSVWQKGPPLGPPAARMERALSSQLSPQVAQRIRGD